MSRKFYRFFSDSFKEKVKLNYALLKRSRSEATYITVTGSSAKSTTVALIFHILSATTRVKAQVLGNSQDITLKTLATVNREHEYVVMELGTHGPGDIPEMVKVVRPHIAIVTLVGLEHYSAFRTKDAVAKEKGSLVKALPPSGLAILNKDDPHVFAMSSLTRARIITFGKSEADYVQGALISTKPGHLTFTLNYRDRKLILETQLCGAHNRLAVSVAAACALELGVSEATVIERIASFEPVFGRLSVHAIDKGPTFILDTAKAPYETIPLALEVLRDCVAPRKRFVLGQISDYAGASRPKYRDTYRAAREVADQVIFVGEHSHKSQATSEEIEAGKFIAFSDVKQLSDYIKSTAIPGEIVLLKSSQNLHLERLMLDWQTEVSCWPNRCGVGQDCRRCGLYKLPFNEHGGNFARR